MVRTPGHFKALRSSPQQRTRVGTKSASQETRGGRRRQMTSCVEIGFPDPPSFPAKARSAKTRNTKHETRNTKHETRNTKHETRNTDPEPRTLNPERPSAPNTPLPSRLPSPHPCRQRP